ncbi:hypothetical protein RN001_008667 [Aquatica leii]|uniref:C2H2-type domain-containing protein n=1 Tax=Aquatica leii TaxID=1421715 RepID=A0AAN7PH89_9COLE|nr:hypothetical protein RN001_008667 [Aquatica leii]
MSDEHQWHFDYTRLVRDTGFTFQLHRPKSSITKSLAHIDIEKIILHQDIALVDKNINTILEYTLDNEQSSVLDQNFVKIFYICQLSVQYLLFCKKYLDNTVARLKKEVANGKETINNLNRKIEEVQQDAANAKTQIKELQSTLTCQIANTQSIPVFQCNQCPKAFSTEEYLLAHIQRRHDTLGHSTSFQVETDKLQSEIKALKERLNNTEKFIHYDNEKLSTKVIDNTKHKSVENTALTELQHTFEMLKMHVDNELRMLKTQKYDQDKYEKWFETFLRKLDCYNNEKGLKVAESDTKVNVNANEHEICLKKHNEEKNCAKNDHTTQTDLMEVDEQICKNCRNNVSSHCSISTIKASSIDHIKEKPPNKPEPTFEKLEEMLQQRVSGSIEKLENQMQFFCDKMHEFEQQNFNSLRTTPSPTHITEVKIVPKPRKKWNPRPITSTSPYLNNTSLSPQLSAKVLERPKLEQSPQHVIEIKSQPKNTNDTTPQPQSVESFDDGHDQSKADVEEKVKGSSDTDSERCKKPVIPLPRVRQKPMSLKSAAVALSVQQHRQKDMIDLLNKQLAELGISSNWSTLPANSYQRALNIVTHQSNLAKKTYSNYNHIRDNILKNVEEEAKKRKQTASFSSKVKPVKKFTKQAKIVAEKPKMYSTESESESEDTIKDRRNFIRKKENVISQSEEAYFDVIQEFTSRTKTKDDVSDVSIDTDTSIRNHQAKSVLKNYPSVSSLHKKKVLFNLKPVDDLNEEKLVIVKVNDNGSTSSIGSSVFDGSKVNLTEHFNRNNHL